MSPLAYRPAPRRALAAAVAWLLAPLAFAVPAQGTTFTNLTPIAVSSDPAVPVASAITVAGMTGVLTSVSMSLNQLTTAGMADLDFLLVSPTGLKFIVASDAGGFAGASNATLGLSDAAGSTLPANIAVISGNYRPTNHGGTTDPFGAPAPAGPYASPAPTGTATFASVFNGAAPNGTWTLYAVSDQTSGGATLASGWTLTLTSAPLTSTVTSLASSQNPSFATAPNNLVAFTATVFAGTSAVTTGTVTFTSGSTVLGANLALNAAGQAVLPATFTAEGVYPVLATYVPAAGFAASSGSLSQRVDQHTVVAGGSFTNPGPVIVPDPLAAPVWSRVFVSGFSGVPSSVRLTLNGLTTPAANDLDILLVSPAGQTFVCLSDVGGANPATAVTLALDDAAASALPAASALTSGTWRPTDAGVGADPFGAPAPAGPYNSALPNGTAGFSTLYLGNSPNGMWSLYVIDDTPGGGASTLGSGWTLTFGQPAQGSTTTLSSTPNPSYTDAPDQRVTFRATTLAAGSGLPVGAAGTVTFSEGATVLAADVPQDTLGVATFSTTTLAEGTHFVSARFNGSSTYNVSTGTLGQTVFTHTLTDVGSYCDPSPITVADGGTAGAYPSRIFVKNIIAPLVGFTVTLKGLTHNAPADLDLLLVGPAGERYVLMADAGGALAVTGVTLTLDDDAANALPQNSQLTSGHWRPRAYTSVAFPLPAPVAPYLAAAPLGTSTLASAIGSLGNGTWSLYIADDTGGNGGGSLSGGWCLDFDPAIVGVAPFETPLTGTRLAPPAPSPMHGLTRLRYTLSAAGEARLDVLEVSGRLVRSLRRAHEPAGPHDCTWDGRDDTGRALPAGLYFVRLRAGDTFSMQRLVITR